MRLKDKVAIVTGGSRGIGRAICVRLANEGAQVVVNYSEKADCGEFIGSADKVVDEIVSASGEAVAFEADVADRDSVYEMIDFAAGRYGSLDIMVANAGVCPFSEFLKIDEELLDSVINVNLKGSFFCAQASMKKMIEKNIQGRIVFTSSISSVFGGELQAHYCSTKGAINQLMKSVAIAAGKYGITSNAVLPGTVITDINLNELENDPELKHYFKKRTPLGNLVTPEDVANATLFFTSDEASCISGATLIVDGGMSINLQ
ncbi:MAG: SDR family oxidoreductase [Bacteroidetes bacterium]|jgi:L-rhamnose 1-dehydrogenase|nr:SDR family oxidoreductase [Bacteroidota bacterium]